MIYYLKNWFSLLNHSVNPFLLNFCRFQTVTKHHTPCFTQIFLVFCNFPRIASKRSAVLVISYHEHVRYAKLSNIQGFYRMELPICLLGFNVLYLQDRLEFSSHSSSLFPNCFFYQSSCSLISPVDSKLILFWNSRSNDSCETAPDVITIFLFVVRFRYISIIRCKENFAAERISKCTCAYFTNIAFKRITVTLILLIK